MTKNSEYWENDKVIEDLEKGWYAKEDKAKDATKEWIENNVTSSDTFLDVGCGTGFYAPVASEACGIKNYLGIDITKKMVEACRKKYPGLKFQAGDILDLSEIADASFDIVMSCDVIMHIIEGCANAIRELYRVAKKKILIKTPITNIEDYGIRKKAGKFERPPWIAYNKENFMNMVKKVAMEKDKITIHNIRGIKSKIKKECYWALIEIEKN